MHQARHYGSKVTEDRVVVHAHQVGIHMHRKSICAGHGHLPSIEVVVPAPHTLFSCESCSQHRGTTIDYMQFAGLVPGHVVLWLAW